MTRPLTRVVSWGHELLAESVGEGQLVVDLTAGNGFDTLMLWRLVGPSGQVLAFDIQSAALHNTRLKLEAEGAVVRMREAEQQLPLNPGVDLIQGGHERLERYLSEGPSGVVANLGYLPGGEQSVITKPGSTLAALQQACRLLRVGGRIAVVVYTGHPGGEAEGSVVDVFFSSLNEESFQVLRLTVANRPQAPYLLVAEKRQ
jgi:predicted methyltransferase